MIPVLETEPGVFREVRYDEILISVDGSERTPAPVVLHDSWSADDRARYGVFMVEPAVAPLGMRARSMGYERLGGVVAQVLTLEAAPDAGHAVTVAAGFATMALGILSPLVGVGFSSVAPLAGTVTIPGRRVRFYFAGEGQPDLNYQAIPSIRHTAANTGVQIRTKSVLFVELWTAVDALEYAVEVKRYV